MRNYINLTNGLEAIDDYDLKDYVFMRLQSTHCEQKRWEDVLASVPDDLLFHAARGERCVVYDYGANKARPMAVWQGLEWVKFALWKNWFDALYQPVGKAETMGGYFRRQYSLLSKRALSRLAYYRPLVDGRMVYLRGETESTRHDGDKEFYASIAKRKV